MRDRLLFLGVLPKKTRRFCGLVELPWRCLCTSMVAVPTNHTAGDFTNLWWLHHRCYDSTTAALADEDD